MVRPLRGSVIPRRLSDDTLVIDVRIRGEGAAHAGLVAGVERDARSGVARPQLLPAALLGQDWTQLIPTGAPSPGLDDGPGVTVRVAISEYVDSLNRYDNEKTRNAYRTPVVKHLLPFLAYADKARTRERPLREVDEPLMLQFVAVKKSPR